MIQEQLRMQMLAGIITEGQYKVKLSEIRVNNPLQKIEGLFYKEDGSYFYDEENLTKFIRNMGYNDAEEITNEIMTLSSPEDDLEMFRNKYNQPNLKIEDITFNMFKQSIEDEFEK